MLTDGAITACFSDGGVAGGDVGGGGKRTLGGVVYRRRIIKGGGVQVDPSVQNSWSARLEECGKLFSVFADVHCRYSRFSWELLLRRFRFLHEALPQSRFEYQNTSSLSVEMRHSHSLEAQGAKTKRAGRVRR